ncbi:DUF2280 domain-containing protein [Pseudomonas proteolytica]|uniref:DUF2280 domain-containing protein n=1 Tax=Pseudomonas proteolytica TaxID=219574 RepID=UPI0030EDDD5C
MAALKNEVKSFIVQALACFDTPSQVVEAVKNEYGLVVSRQQVETHDPTKSAGKGLAVKWVTLFHDTRKRFREETAEIPIANRAYRLRGLGRMAEKAESMRNYEDSVFWCGQAQPYISGLDEQWRDHMEIRHCPVRNPTPSARGLSCCITCTAGRPKSSYTAGLGMTVRA